MTEGGRRKKGRWWNARRGEWGVNRRRKVNEGSGTGKPEREKLLRGEGKLQPATQPQRKRCEDARKEGRMGKK